MPVIIEFSGCIGTYPSAKFELINSKSVAVVILILERKQDFSSDFGFQNS